MTGRSDKLHIAAGLELDADYAAGASFGVLAKRGAGKTYTGRVLVEELFAAQVQCVVIDPTGAWWGLRSSADGEKDGLPLPVFGGRHGDVPLEPTAGTLMADLVVRDRLSMILDLRGFSRAQERQFGAAFFDRVYRKNDDLVHLLIDEADLFAPQKPQRQDAQLLEAVENIVRQGRNHGIGCTLFSQRPAVLNKDVLTQIDGLVALRATAPQDRDAIRDWVSGQGGDEKWREIAPSLPNLANGESWWWIPEKGVLNRVQVRRAHTFDSSPTRRRGRSGREPKTFADVDLQTISGRIQATIERARENDPRELQRRIASLEHELRDRDRQLADQRPQTRPAAPVEILDPALVERLERAVASLGRPDEEITEAAAALNKHLEHAVAGFARPAQELTAAALELTEALRVRRATSADPDPPTPTGQPRQEPRPAPRREATVTGTTMPVTPARQRLLDALVAMESIGVAQVSKTQLALWAGVSPKSSGYQNNLGGLRSLGLIDYPQSGYVGLTDEGRAHADTSIAANLITTEEVHEHVRSLLPPSRWRIIEALLTAYPESMTKNELADAAGVSPTSSGYQNNLGGLRSLGLIDYPQPGHVVATSVLFLER